jgi:hypothetical protein
MLTTDVPAALGIVPARIGRTGYLDNPQSSLPRNAQHRVAGAPLPPDRTEETGACPRTNGAFTFMYAVRSSPLAGSDRDRWQVWWRSRDVVLKFVEEQASCRQTNQ